ncbi:MAG: hypothetical protein AB7H90_02900 [Alphaproteobacteria bacterium]
MSWEACIAEIRQAAGRAGERLSDRDIEQMLDKIVREARRKSGIGTTTADAIRMTARELAAQERLAGAIEKRNAVLNLAARVGRRERIEAAPDIRQGILAEIHGINTPTTGARFSTEAEWKALTRQYQGWVIQELESDGLLGAAKSREMERQWARELAELSKGADKSQGGNPSVTGSPEALRIAEIVHKAQTLAKTNLNRVGAWIGDYMGYIARTEHNPERLRRAGRAAWKERIAPLLDDRTFDGIGEDAGDAAARGRFLDRIYNALVSGVHLSDGAMQGFKDPAFTGPGNMAKRLSQERVLHFRDADAWLDYREQFGNPGSLLESLMHGLDRGARATALMRRWGTNPRAEFDAEIKYWAETLRGTDPDMAERIQRAGGDRGDLRNRFDFLDGTADIPENMAKLGMVGITDLTGIATHAAELRYQGVNLLEGYRNALVSLVRGPRGHTAETREIMDLLLAGHEGMLRDITARFEPDDTIPGTLSRLQNVFFKLTGTTYLNATERSGAEFAMARELGSQLDRPYAELKSETARVLRLYGIEAGEWELLRAVRDPAMIEDRAFVTPDMALRIDPGRAAYHLYQTGRLDRWDIDRTTGRIVNRYREELALRLQTYFDDRSRFVMITPGIATKTDMLRGTRPGTFEGEFLRFVGQFKSWPVAMIRMGLGREIYGQERPAMIAGLLHLFVAGTVLGYGVMVLKDLLKGRWPRDPADPGTWLAAMAQGGGAGIRITGCIWRARRR